MTETKTATQPNDEQWYTRPILTVADMPQALAHYCDLLGFMQDWKHDEDGRTIVTQVNKGECELILEEARSSGISRVYVSLEAVEMQCLEQLIEEKSIPVEHVFWGYDLVRICDPAGNQLLVSAAC